MGGLNYMCVPVSSPNISRSHTAAPEYRNGIEKGPSACPRSSRQRRASTPVGHGGGGIQPWESRVTARSRNPHPPDQPNPNLSLQGRAQIEVSRLAVIVEDEGDDVSMEHANSPERGMIFYRIMNRLNINDHHTSRCGGGGQDVKLLVWNAQGAGNKHFSNELKEHL
ncbi:hypothetical protein Cgig2_023907 [Carnegiea gigantea]|uniref:Uncharacterized protein n=1 Tax=Carnegiea gigantea TaxID=171969 RepID=A0A9Q1GJN2_9CARY|nr:hypothetical protein Cgig2_023907 [Carnegiea gigantea]